eukprot:g6378.t1
MAIHFPQTSRQESTRFPPETLLPHVQSELDHYADLARHYFGKSQEYGLLHEDAEQTIQKYKDKLHALEVRSEGRVHLRETVIRDRNDECEDLRKAITLLRKEHAEQIAKLKQEHSKRITALNRENEQFCDDLLGARRLLAQKLNEKSEILGQLLLCLVCRGCFDTVSFRD